MGSRKLTLIPLRFLNIDSVKLAPVKIRKIVIISKHKFA